MITSLPGQKQSLTRLQGHAVSTFIVDEAREGHIIANFDLKAFPGGLEVRPPVFCGEENRVEIVRGVDTPCRQEGVLYIIVRN